MPIRSSGCSKCRQRRIRCDEARPGCQRCATHGVPCPGYRIARPGGVEFRNITLDTVQRATTKYRQKGYDHDKLQDLASSSSASETDKSSSPASSVTSERLSPKNDSTELTTKDLSVMQTWTDCLLPLGLLQGLQESSPKHFNSSTAMSSQIYSAFLDTYLPKDQRFSNYHFFHELALRPNHEPSLVRSLNALSLAAVGSARKDPVLQQEAVMEYGRALQCLSRTVARPGFEPSDEILATVSMLALCEFYDVLKQPGGWARHQQGGQTMLLARGGVQGVRSRFSLLLFSNSKHSQLPQGLIGRKALMMGKKAWRALLFKSPIVDESTYFYDLALQVPALLERKDNLDLDSPLILSDIDALLEDCAKLELGLRTWFAAFAPNTKLMDVPLYNRVPIDDFATFASLVADRTFQTSFWFPSFPFGYLAAMYFSTMHCLRSDMLALYTLRQGLDAKWSPEEDMDNIAVDIRQLAENCCMCIPYFCEPVSSMAGSIGIFLPLGIAALYYLRSSDWPKLRWVKAVREGVFVKGLSPPTVRFH